MEQKPIVETEMPSLSSVARTTPYSRRAPSPPPFAIHPPSILCRDGVPVEVTLAPSLHNRDPSQLTSKDLDMITGNTMPIVVKANNNWKYEARRKAQRLLDYLYLGPNAAIRDQEFLKAERITLILVVRDSRIATHNLLSCEAAEKALGIECKYVDVKSPQHFIHEFPEAIRTINNHLLSVYRINSQDQFFGAGSADSKLQPRRGKVLVTCETGNDRSATVVAAYIMATWGCDVATSLNYISSQRFCCTFDEDIKRLLKSWEDLVRARATVARSQARDPSPNPMAKRGFEDTMDVDSSSSNREHGMTDDERFNGRASFAPFIDTADAHRA
jgi:serine/threonine/tyrosine-interacting protein